MDATTPSLSVPGSEAKWTIETYAAHNEAMREADTRFQGERDRRYAEVSNEREKALKIKETADLAALSLAREIQDYKDEKANNLRTQIEGERGLYATKDELKAALEKHEETMKPLVAYVATQQGRSAGINATIALLVTAVTIILGASGIAIALIIR